jgi:uncharacterized protein
MDPLRIIEKYYKKDSDAYNMLVTHSTMVTKKALDVAKRYKKKHPEVEIDMTLIEEAAMLHDIGSFLTCSKRLGSPEGKPYLCHGVLGKEVLEKEGLPKHALIAERHIGVGITKKEVVDKQMPLPKHDMIPKTIEEEIVCYADCFFSKEVGRLEIEESLDAIRDELQQYGVEKVKVFDKMVEKFGDR